MPTHSPLHNDKDANEAASRALRGAAVGACRYGAPLLALSIAGHALSPIYRGLTIQFKVFLLMSGMVVGGAIEGDRRLREYEAVVRARRRESGG